MIVRHANESLLLSILPTQKCGMFNIRLLQHAHHFEYFPFTIEYSRVPMIVIVDPKMPNGEMGFLNAMTDAMMMTTRLIVFPTACVIGWTRPSAMNATSL